jgi:hypothetical protein
MAARRPLLSPEETAKLEKELESVPVNRAAVDDEEDKKSASKTGTIGIRSFSDGSQHQPE